MTDTSGSRPDQPREPVPSGEPDETRPIPRTPEQFLPPPAPTEHQSQGFASEGYPAAPPAGARPGAGYPVQPASPGYPPPARPPARSRLSGQPLLFGVIGGVLVVLLALLGGFAGGFVVGHAVGRHDGDRIEIEGPDRTGPFEWFGPGDGRGRDRDRDRSDALPGLPDLTPRDGTESDGTESSAPTPAT